MKIKTARYLKSCGSLKECGENSVPEFAFIGRSNVGKSSLINMLTNNGKLAYTSANPGKTQCINFFSVNEQWTLVDLPGYGYAKVSKEKRAIFGKMIQSYLQKRENLMCIFALIDSRIEPQAIDLEFISWLGKNNLPFAILFTKCDKLSKQKMLANVVQFKQALRETWSELPYMIITSATERTGKEELLDFIATTMQNTPVVKAPANAKEISHKPEDRAGDYEEED